MAAEVIIRKLSSQEEFEKLVEIQQTIWKHPDLDLTPIHQFCISSLMGGLVIGAFVDGELAGFVYSFPAIYNGKFCHHSHLLAVLPQFQGYGLGKRLKWAQRDEVLKMGLNLITWTYDPLQTRNANLNFHTLGVICRTYLENFYGETPALKLGPGIPTDRLLVEWPIKAARVKKKAEIKKENEELPDLSFLPKGLEGFRAEDGSYRPDKSVLNLKTPVILVETVRDVRSLQSTPEIIADWQAALKEVLTGYFQRGYAITEFLFGERCFYLLSKFTEKRRGKKK